MSMTKEQQDEAVRLLREWAGIEAGECRYDHHGACQEHYASDPCPVSAANAFLASLDAKAPGQDAASGTWVCQKGDHQLAMPYPQPCAMCGMRPDGATPEQDADDMYDLEGLRQRDLADASQQDAGVQELIEALEWIANQATPHVGMGGYILGVSARDALVRYRNKKAARS